LVQRLFGTNGIRGVVNKDMTSELALQVGKAIGAIMSGTVAIATDTRVSADMIKTAVSAGIMSTGRDVIDLGVLPTPAAQYFVKTHDEVRGGVMITASHNPPEFNGIKCISADGTELSRAEEEEIEGMYAKDIPCEPWDKVGKIEKIRGAGEEYIDAILSHVDVESIRAAKLKVCLDCANGAAYDTTPLLLKKLNVRAITINCNPQGEFPGHESEPEEKNLKDLKTLIKSTSSDLGIAHDGDADRCIFITKEGKYVSGDKSLALMSKYILSQKNGIVVTPVSSSSLVEEVVEKVGGKLEYTAVGSPIVARKMMENGAVFGGEENGGLIFPELQYCRDGGMAVAKMIECIVKEGPLHKQIEKLPIYYTVKVKVACADNVKKYVLDHLIEISDGAKIDKTDGLKLTFDDGWVLARPSGTEPMFRIYSESKDSNVAEARAKRYEDAVETFLRKAN
jgi:phosphoglucosamine mutase